MWKRLWKQLWKTWTIDKPAAFGDLLWDVLVVQFAAWLDQLKFRHAVTFIAIAILVSAYIHQVPVHPGIMLVGDLVAYIDIVSAVFLLGVLSRVTTVLFVVKQASARALELARTLLANMRRLDIRHRREGGAKAGKRSGIRASSDDEDGVGFG